MQHNLSLKPYNTFGIDVTAEYFAEINSVDELQSILKEYNTVPLLILGGGSNIVFTKNVEGLVIRMNTKGIEKTKEDDTHVWVKVQAGENWHEFVQWSLTQNYGGLENLSLIPGNVGTSPMQNIGAYGVEIKDVFDSLEALEIATGAIKTFTLSDCAFGYRESVFKRELKGKYIIISVTYCLNKPPHTLHTSYGAIQHELESMKIENPTIQEVSKAVIQIRKSKLPDPKQIGNSGSFFKNPTVPKAIFQNLQQKYPSIPSYPIDEQTVKIPAGWLIEQSGWKGKRIGDAGVHTQQALVLVNYGNATGQEILNLSQQIIQDIQNQFGITLEREVNIY